MTHYHLGNHSAVEFLSYNHLINVFDQAKWTSIEQGDLKKAELFECAAAMAEDMYLVEDNEERVTELQRDLELAKTNNTEFEDRVRNLISAFEDQTRDIVYSLKKLLEKEN